MICGKKYHEEYPDGLKRTSFMCRLNGQFKYREDLGGTRFSIQ